MSIAAPRVTSSVYNEADRRVLKYGIILTSQSLKNWHVACIDDLQRSGNARLACVVHKANASAIHRESQAVYESLCAAQKVPSQAGGPMSVLAEAQPDLREIHAPLSSSEDDWKQYVRGLDLDFLLLFGEFAAGLDLVDAARYGVWYFAHSDATRFSSDAPGFWEVHSDHDVTGAMLLKISRGEVAGVMLKSGYYPTAHYSFRDNVETLFAESVKWPARVCHDIIAGAAQYFQDTPIPRPPLHMSAPTKSQILSMRFTQAKNSAKKYLYDVLFREYWAVGTLNASPSQFIDADIQADIEYLYRHGKNTFLADPCLLKIGSRTYLFCEEYRYNVKRGLVVVSELSSGTTATTPQPAIDLAYHLSYPQVFQHDGQVFCIPEASGIRKVPVYRAVELPHRWELFHTLLEDFSAADSTLLRHDNKWWLFCTSSESFPRGHNSHLYIWYADDLYGTWKPHERNPVKIDIRSSRPAGQFFTHGGNVYRPAQDCSRTYGGALRINRIDKLSETEFEERIVGTITPPQKSYNKGIHTISLAGDYCIVDAKRYVFNRAGIMILCRLAGQAFLLRLGVRPQTLQSIKKRLGLWPTNPPSELRKQDSERIVASRPIAPDP